jgi:hypothetical protein
LKWRLSFVEIRLLKSLLEVGERRKIAATIDQQLSQFIESGREIVTDCVVFNVHQDGQDGLVLNDV